MDKAEEVMDDVKEEGSDMMDAAKDKASEMNVTPPM
jgi:hypothetical protein